MKPFSQSTITENKKATYNYTIEDTLEAGIVLWGSEVKSLRLHKGNINDAFAEAQGEAIYLINAHIAEYKGANNFNHSPKRHRKLLLKKREIRRLIGSVQRKGISLIPLKLYLSPKGKIKVLLGLAKGKKQHDKRESIKQREWNRAKQRLLKES